VGLIDYLRKEAMCMELASRERDDAIRALLEQLAEANLMERRLVEPTLQAILDRERVGSTAIGRGVAVPHARLEGIEKTLVAFGYSSAGVAFNALDGEAVHEIFLVVAPRASAGEYIEVMQRITRLIQDQDFRRFVSRARCPAEVVDLIAEMDL